MTAFRMILTTSRFLKAIALLGFLYIFATDFLYRRSPLLFEKIMHVCSFAILRFLRITLVSQIHRREDFPKNALYICNHSSSFEIFMMPCLFKKTDFVFTSDALKVPFFKKIFKKCPVIFVKGKSFRDRKNSLIKMQERLRAGRNVMLFPEGYSHKFLGPYFEKGAFQVAYETGYPIVPVYLHYDNLDVFVPDQVVSHKKEFFRILNAKNKKITAHVFDSVYPKSFSTVTEFRDAVYNQYQLWQEKFYGTFQ